MGCRCDQASGRAECSPALGDPELHLVPWLRDLCRDNCGCREDDTDSESDRSDATQRGFRGPVAHQLSNTPWNTDSEDSGVSGQELISRLDSLTSSSALCYGECSRNYLGCGDLENGCRCVARRRNHKISIVGCRIPWLSGYYGGKRGLAMDPNEVCFCNSTYISQACCEVSDGLVFESPQLMLGALETNTISSSSFSTTLLSSTASLSSSSLSATPDAKLNLQRRILASDEKRQLINCRRKPVLNRSLRRHRLPEGYHIERYRNLWEFCQLSNYRSDTMGCFCEPGYEFPICDEEQANPVLYASSALRVRCLTGCECPHPESNIVEYDPKKGPDRKDDQDEKQEYSISEAGMETEGPRQPEGKCRSGCTGFTFSCFSGGGGVKDDHCRCATEFVGPGLWSNWHCVDAVSQLTSLSAGLGGRDVDSGVLQDDLVCPCNRTYVSKSCCEADGGLVWEPPELRLGRLV